MSSLSRLLLRLLSLPEGTSDIELVSLDGALAGLGPIVPGVWSESCQVCSSPLGGLSFSRTELMLAAFSSFYSLLEQPS